MPRACTAAATALAVLAGACAPSGEWRELRPEHSGIVVQFPCKPDRHERTVRLGDSAVAMQLLVCSAGGVTFALAYADIPEPGGVTPALAQLRAAAVANLGAAAAREDELRVPGMTPNDRAGRLRFEGRRPDGLALHEQAGFFARGLRVYQASVLAPALPDETADTFFASLRLVV